MFVEVTGEKLVGKERELFAPPPLPPSILNRLRVLAQTTLSV